jgi:hypothetical protein
MIGTKAHSAILFRGTPKAPAKPFAPAIAALGRRALVVFRVDDRLEAVWTDDQGQIEGRFVVATANDLGAPATSIAGDAPYVVWAERAALTAPYRLHIARIGSSGVEGTAVLDTGEGSAFAPALAARGDMLALAWMEGDDQRQGTVRRALLPLERLRTLSSAIVLDGTVDVTPSGGNRRDPELAAVDDRLYLAFSDFTTHKHGKVVVETLRCP